jgi:DNA-binding CsgD family transcriptional regulator
VGNTSSDLSRCLDSLRARRILEGVLEVKERQLRSAFELLYDAASHDGTEPFPREFLERLARIIPADAIVGYHDAFVGTGGRTVEAVEIPAGAVSVEILENAFRLSSEDPLNHCRRAREHRVLKLSDFFTPRQLRKLDHYWAVWHPLGIDDSLRVWLPAPAGRTRTLYLERSKRQFTESDRSLLEVLRPSLVRLLGAALARRKPSDGRRTPLTNRESEILEWVARGKTTREIAAALFLSPHTVRKHVENILEKLQVETRSAAVARAGVLLRSAPGQAAQLD